MKPTFAQAREALSALDPARTLPAGSQALAYTDPDSILDGTYRAPTHLAHLTDLTHLDGPVAERRHQLSRRAALSMGGTLTVAAVTVVATFGVGSGTTHAATATPAALAYSGVRDISDAKSQLAAIADRTAALPDTAGQGRYEHLRYQQWSLFTRIDGNQVRSAVVPQQTEQWLAADGSGKMIRTFVAPVFSDHAQEQAWKDAGSPGKNQPPTVLTSVVRIWNGRPPQDPTALTAWLQQGHPAAAGPQETMVAITDLVTEQVLNPAERAAVLRVLGTVPGLIDLGTTTDRAGRPAHAFAVDSAGNGLPTRYTLLIDPTNGSVLGFEQTLTQSAGKLNVPIPSVIGYSLYQSADRTDTAG